MEQAILRAIVLLVKRTPGRSAKEYSKKLRDEGIVAADRTLVNSILYKHSHLFDRCLDNESIPRWFLSSPEAAEQETPEVEPKPLRQKIKRPNTVVPAPRSKYPLELYAWQEEALDRWRENKCQGVVEAVTGAGKTRIGLCAAIEQIRNNRAVLILVPTLDLLYQWQDQFRQHMPKTRIGLCGDGHNTNFNHETVIISTVQTARRYQLFPPKSGALVIADECHRYGSETNQLALEPGFTKRLGLSATYARSDDGNAVWLDPYFGGKCFTLDYKRAIADGVISKFSVALIGVKFTDAERAEYDEHSRLLRKLRTALIHDHGVTEEPFGVFMSEVNQLNKANIGEATWCARKYLNRFAKRRKLLADSPAKFDALIKLESAIRNAERLLIFTQTIDGCEIAAESLRRLGIYAKAIHSKIPMDERREIFDEFSRGSIKVVVAPQVLDEGVDVPEADFAIILAASKIKRQMIQRMGRILRRKSDGRIARFAILYIEDTSEDPSNGAHDEFLDEIRSVAIDEKVFNSTARASVVSDFLSDYAARG